MSEENWEDVYEGILERQLSRLWAKLIILDCFNKKMSLKATVEHLHKIGDFGQEVFTEMAKKEGFEKEDEIKK